MFPPVAGSFAGYYVKKGEPQYRQNRWGSTLRPWSAHRPVFRACAVTQISLYPLTPLPPAPCIIYLYAFVSMPPRHRRGVLGGWGGGVPVFLFSSNEYLADCIKRLLPDPASSKLDVPATTEGGRPVSGAFSVASVVGPAGLCPVSVSCSSVAVCTLFFMFVHYLFSSQYTHLW